MCNSLLLACVPVLLILSHIQVSAYGGAENKVAPPSNPCVDQTLGKCQFEFNQQLNIPSLTDWKNPLTLNQQIQNTFITNGTQGLLQICNAWHNFYQCLGPKMVQACLNPMHFLSHYNNYANSYLYVGIIKQIQFICSAGFAPLSYSTCVQNTWKTQLPRLNTCFLTYWNVVNNNHLYPGCSPAQNLLHCFSNVFVQQQCGAEGSWWGCEYQRVSVSQRFYNCNFKCQFGSNVINEEADHV